MSCSRTKNSSNNQKKVSKKEQPWPFRNNLESVRIQPTVSERERDGFGQMTRCKMPLKTRPKSKLEIRLNGELYNICIPMF